MMSFIDDDRVVVIGSKLSQSFFTHKRLNTADGNPIPRLKSRLLGFFYGTFKARSFRYLIGGLF